ncbi:preprotein translocase subunit SecE [Pectinatus sottacetonis]|uniref:preprotein translocase subunit SecE n=1 Tax=Pectinatus sottacetonis TaxID=1002795 RepID=UPI0018C6F1B4|nr:preprotein translocase subunit SecE [Pectinatus sottacetonis]
MTTEEKKNHSFNLKEFLNGVMFEMKKVVWPTRKELSSYTAVVFIAVIFVCALIWICDNFFARVLELILR